MAIPRKTAGMLNFERQLDEAFPERRRPDGWIGDPDHQGRTSSHNPDDTPGARPEWNGDPDNIPDVRAVDVSAQLGPDVRMRAVCDHLADLPNLGSVVRYFIHDGQIWHVNNGFGPVPHSGDPHEEHLHVTFAFSESADDNTTYDYHLEDLMATMTVDQLLDALESPRGQALLAKAAGRGVANQTLGRSKETIGQDLQSDDAVIGRRFDAIDGKLAAIESRLH